MTAFLAFVLVFVPGCTVLFVGFSFEGGDARTLDSLLVLFLLVALTAVAGYEVMAVSRRGQTLGKNIAGIRVQCDDQAALAGDLQPPDFRQCAGRWAISHGIGVLVAIVAALVAVPRIKDYGGYVGVAAGVAVWAAVYASSLLDKNGRGWHDKAAGTIVVVGGELEPVEPGGPDRSPPSGGQDTTKHAPDPAAPEADPHGEKPSYGLVSDYYAPVHKRPPPDRDDTQT